VATRAREPGLSSSWTVNQTIIARHLLAPMVAMRDPPGAG
jgi:hypothetical protein